MVQGHYVFITLFMVQWYETRRTKGTLEILTSKIIWFLANVLVKPVFTARLTAKTRLNIDSNRNIRYSYMTLDEIISSVYDIPSSTQITNGISIWNQKMKPIYGLYKLYRLDKGNFKIGLFPTYGLSKDWFIRMNLTLTIKMWLPWFEVIWGHLVVNLYLILGCHVKSKIL